MSAAELLLALQVRQLATDLRSAAKASYYASIYEKTDEIVRAANLAQWDSAHPIEPFLDQATDEVGQVAAYLAKRDAISTL